jgi:hypothetical protein
MLLLASFAGLFFTCVAYGLTIDSPLPNAAISSGSFLFKLSGLNPTSHYNLTLESLSPPENLNKMSFIASDSTYSGVFPVPYNATTDDYIFVVSSNSGASNVGLTIPSGSFFQRIQSPFSGQYQDEQVLELSFIASGIASTGSLTDPEIGAFYSFGVGSPYSPIILHFDQNSSKYRADVSLSLDNALTGAQPVQLSCDGGGTVATTVLACFPQPAVQSTRIPVHLWRQVVQIATQTRP